MSTQPWTLSHRFSPRAVRLADRHYSRQKPGTPQFVPPGRNLVFLTADARAVWCSLDQDVVKHRWKGAWVCSIFRNEGAGLSSDLIRLAVSATVAVWGPLPRHGFVTFVDARKTRRKRDPGRCFRRAGWRPVGNTIANGYLILRLSPCPAPPALAPIGFTPSLFDREAEGFLRDDREAQPPHA